MKKLLSIFLCIFLISGFILTGCGSDSDLSLDTLIKDLQKGDDSNAKNILIKSDTNDEFKLYDDTLASSDIGKEYYKNITFKVIKLDKEKNTATAKVKFEYPNMKNLCEKTFNDIFVGKDIASTNFSKDILINDITKKLNDKSFDKENKEIDISFEKGTDDWLIKDSSNLNEILCTQLNYIYTLYNCTDLSLNTIKSFKNLDIDWIKKHFADFNLNKFNNDNVNELKSYLTKISSKDKIQFTSCSLTENKLNINVTSNTPDIPSLVNDNSVEISDKIMHQATETNSNIVTMKAITDCLNTKKFNMLEYKFNLESEVNPNNKIVSSTTESTPPANIMNYIFGDLDEVSGY